METMLKMMTARIGSMTLCVAFSSLAVSSLAAQEQSVLQRTQAETQLNSPTNNLLEAAGIKPSGQGEQPSQEDLDLLTKEMLIKALADYEGTMLFVSHDRHFLAALSNRVLELTPDGIHQYGGGYTEYVASTGQEAPGLHS